MKVLEIKVLTVVILFVISCENANKIDYPPIIIEQQLKKTYEKSIIDWHILNSMGQYSKSKFLLIYDTIVEKKLYARDSISNVNLLNRDFINNKELMKETFPTKVLDFFEVELEMFDHPSFEVQRGDTVVITLFPKYDNFDYIIDPVDGIIHTIYYVNGKVIKVGQNDYIEYDLPDSLLRANESKLIELVNQKEKNRVDKTLWYLIQQKELQLLNF